jgi:MFS transporter, DHA1 family, tetracycline resistance protein
VKTPSSDRKALGIAFFIVFLDMLGASILIPVVPYIVRAYRPDAMTVGWLSLSYSAAQFLATPVLGAVSDRVGRRPVLLISILGSAFGYFLFGWAGSLWVLFASRILDGLTGGNISTAQAYIADRSQPEDRAKNFGMIGAAFGLGFILGPAFGGALSKISLQAPAFAAGIVSLITFLTALFFLRESLPPEKRQRTPFALRQLNPLGHIVAPLKRPVLRWLLPGFFALAFAMSGLTSNFAVYTLNRYGLTPSQNALILVWLGFVSVVIQGGVVRRLLPRVGENRLASEALVLSVIGYAALAWGPTLWFLYLAIGIIAVGNGLGGPAMQGLLSRQAEAHEQGTLMGVSASLSSLARVGGPLFAGAVFDHLGMGAPYWFGALFMLAGLFLVRAATRDAHVLAPVQQP